jgi:hypothetical protein
MVKHGTQKKRRSGRTGSVKLRQKVKNHSRPQHCTDLNVAKVWDKSKSVNYNYKQLGLATLTKDENDRHDNPVASSNKPTDKSKAIELFDVPADGIMPENRKNRIGRLPLSIQDQKYIVRLLEKYGVNYVKMFRDIRINNMQHSEAQLKKMASKFYNLTDEQRRVSVSEKVLVLCRGHGKQPAEMDAEEEE